MNTNINNYYCVTYNSKGKSNLIDSNIINLEKIYAIKSSSKTGITYLINKLKEYYSDNKYSIELIHNPIDNSIIQGLINLDLNIGIFDNELLDKIFNTTIFLDLDLNIKCSYKITEIDKLKSKIDEHLNYAIKHFTSAKEIHDEWEQVYLNHINFSEADKLAIDICDTIFENYNNISTDFINDCIPLVRVRFFGAISPDGAHNYLNEILDNYNNRYYIKGRPGTCKSTIMKHIANKAQELGLDTDIYNCASDVDSVDMVCINQIDTCIFDSTAPHEFFPTKDDDVIIDTYDKLLPIGFDEEHESEIKNIKTKYQNHIVNGINELKDVKKYMKILEDGYGIIDFDGIQNIFDKIIS